jgi:predicted nucleotidyltransferase
MGVPTPANIEPRLSCSIRESCGHTTNTECPVSSKWLWWLFPGYGTSVLILRVDAVLQCDLYRTGKAIMRPDVLNLLQEFRDLLRNSIGDNLKFVILYGSQARGDATADSDVDVLVVLRDARTSDRERIYDIAYRLMWDCGFELLLSLNIIDHEHYSLLRDHNSSYLQNIEREGGSLWPISETSLSVG